jgi:hypothetical protein
VSAGPKSAPNPRTAAPAWLISFLNWLPNPESSAAAALSVAPAASFTEIVKSLTCAPASAFASFGPAFAPNRSAAFCARSNGSSVFEMSSMRPAAPRAT